MKLSKKVKIFIAVMAIVLIAITGFVLASGSEPTPLEDVVTRDHSSVYFEQEPNDPTKINVYLGMNDSASIASFQIGLEIDMADCYDSTFDWTTGDLTKNNPKFKEAISSEKDKDEVTGNLKENLNLYYVGTEELNQLEKDEDVDIDVDHIKLGTINIIPDEEANIPVRSSYVSIQARDNFSKTVSLSHEPEPIKVDLDEMYSGNIILKEVPSIDNLTAHSEAIVEGDVPNPEEVNGSKVVVDFEVNNTTNSLTALEVQLIDAEGNVKDKKTLDISKLSEQIPVNFIVKDEGVYKIQIVGSYVVDGENGEETVSNVVLKSSSGQNAEISNIEVVHTTEPKDPTPSNPGETDPTPSNPDGTDPTPSNPEGTNPTPSNPEGTDQTPTNPSTPNGGNSNRPNGSLNTGGNRSVTWIVVTLVVLVIVAIGIVIVKYKMKKGTKH